jgi:hypothetical protein
MLPWEITEAAQSITKILNGSKQLVIKPRPTGGYEISVVDKN